MGLERNFNQFGSIDMACSGFGMSRLEELLSKEARDQRSIALETLTRTALTNCSDETWRRLISGELKREKTSDVGVQEASSSDN